MSVPGGQALLSLLFITLITQWSRIFLPMQETRVQSLGREDPLEKEMTAHSIILAWEIPWTVEPGRLQSLGVTKNQT